MKAQLARFAYAIAFLLVGTYAFVTLTGPKGIAALSQKQRSIEVLEKRNTDLMKEIERKREHVRRLTVDPAEQDRVVQERMKLVPPGEKVYMLPPSAPK
jgi:cell division protein FtsB